MGAPEGPIRVLVADDHPVYLDGIAAAIERATDLELTATSRDAAAALRQIRADPPDVAVLDLRMPGMTTEAALAELAGDELDVAVLILSVHVGGEEVHECLSLGAAGYVAKDADRAEICEAIRHVARGRAALSTAVQTNVAAELRARRDDAPALLSPREHEVLELLATGASTPVIAEQLFLSPATVKTHLHHLYEKLEVSDRAAAVAEGLRRGLIA
jgi:two-component system, NarL family, nitrate/nitrite response regulator NarL